MTNRLVYVVPLMNLGETSSLGVRQKIFGQARAFESLGFDTSIVDASLPTRPYPYWVHHEFPFLIKLLRFPFKRVYQFFHAVTFKKRSFSAMLEKLANQGQCLVYLRHGFLSPQVVLFYARVSNLPNVSGVCLEVPTWPYDHEPHARAYEAFLRPLLRRYVNWVVTFSEERQIFGIPAIRITNGIDVSSLPASPRRAMSGSPIRIAVCATLNSWVGVDRLLLGLESYRSRHGENACPSATIVGTGRYAEKWQRHAGRLDLLTKVEFKGALQGQELDAVFAETDVALGNLANHRRNLSSNADLKHREYCARGVPFVVSGSDPGFPESFPFRLEVPQANSALDIERIVYFVEIIRKNFPDHADQMRKYAANHLDWKVILEPVASELRSSKS